MHFKDVLIVLLIVGPLYLLYSDYVLGFTRV